MLSLLAEDEVLQLSFVYVSHPYHSSFPHVPIKEREDAEAYSPHCPLHPHPRTKSILSSVSLAAPEPAAIEMACGRRTH